jgi:cysteinyl-tRNA synthetase
MLIMPLVVYNTLTRRKEEFRPMVEGRVGIYVCGPTVYGHSHLGHAKSYISFDVIVRYLRWSGYKVLYVQNITDVGHLTDDADEGEDKIEKQSRIDRVHPMQLAELYTRSYFEDMDALHLVRPDISPRATGHITEQIELIQQLVDKGAAYGVKGSVYYDVSTFAGYGKLSGRSVEKLEVGARVEVNPDKRHPADFALWKKAEPGHILKWPSPWGVGFPGWHLECSAMSMKYLGESFDIHGGGLENQFPHHECEIAQSEVATGKPFVKYWLHNNMVTVDGQKMGKSLGNFVTLKDAFETWPPEVIRFFVLQSHYRSTLDFSDEAVDGAAKGLEKLTNTLRTLRERIKEASATGAPSGVDLNVYRTAFVDAMNDDFNTPQAIAVLFDLSREVNRLLSNEGALDVGPLREIEAFFETFSDDILGLTLRDTGGAADSHLETSLMEVIIDLRRELRQQKIWPLSDKIRDALGRLGIVLEDKKKDETTWKKVR